MSTSFHFTVSGGSLPATGGIPGARGRVATLVDVLLFQTNDGGEIEIVNGVVTMDDGLATAVFLSLFGGNELDSGQQADDRKQWWGNLGETLSERRYRSETQYLLNTIPAIPANLPRIEDAVGRDVAWMSDTGLSSAISVLATMPGLNRISIAMNIEIGDQRYELAFAARWGN